MEFPDAAPPAADQAVSQGDGEFTHMNQVPKQLHLPRGECIHCVAYCDHFDFDPVGLARKVIRDMTEMRGKPKERCQVYFYGGIDPQRLAAVGAKNTSKSELSECTLRRSMEGMLSDPIWSVAGGCQMECVSAIGHSPTDKYELDFKWYLLCHPLSVNANFTDDNKVYFSLGTEWWEYLPAGWHQRFVDWFVSTVDEYLPWYTGSITLRDAADSHGSLYYNDTLGSCTRWDRMLNWFAWHSEDKETRRHKMRSVEWGNLISDRILGRLGGRDAFADKWNTMWMTNNSLVKRPARLLKNGGLYIQTGGNILEDLRSTTSIKLRRRTDSGTNVLEDHTMLRTKSPCMAEEYAAWLHRELRHAAVII